MKPSARSARLSLALLCVGCAGAPPLPPRSPGLQETIESASGMLARGYPNWATDAAR